MSKEPSERIGDDWKSAITKDVDVKFPQYLATWHEQEAGERPLLRDRIGRFRAMWMVKWWAFRHKEYKHRRASTYGQTRGLHRP